MDAASVGMGAVGLVLAGVWLVASYGERLAPLPEPTTPTAGWVRVALLVGGTASLGLAVVALAVAGDLGRFMWHGLLGVLLLAAGRRREHRAA